MGGRGVTGRTEKTARASVVHRCSVPRADQALSPKDPQAVHTDPQAAHRNARVNHKLPTATPTSPFPAMDKVNAHQQHLGTSGRKTGDGCVDRSVDLWTVLWLSRVVHHPFSSSTDTPRSRAQGYGGIDLQKQGLSPQLTGPTTTTVFSSLLEKEQKKRRGGGQVDNSGPTRPAHPATPPQPRMQLAHRTLYGGKSAKVSTRVRVRGDRHRSCQLHEPAGRLARGTGRSGPPVIPADDPG